MKKNTLKKILKTNSITFTADEIEQLMNDELENSPEMMDTELIDLCLEALTSNKENCKRAVSNNKHLQIKKVLLIAAIISIILGVSIPAGAKFLHMDAADSIVQFCMDHFHVDLRKGDTKAQAYSDERDSLIDAIENEGINSIILPNVLLQNIYQKEEVKSTETEGGISVSIQFEEIEGKKEGTIIINQYTNADYTFAIGQSQISAQFDSVKQLSINGMDVLVFGNDKEAFIDYVDRLTEYHIILNDCSFEEAVEIAQTLN